MENGNRLVVVSGGSKGIGKAIIERLAKEGFSIATCSRNAGDLIPLKAHLEERFGSEIFITQADLSDRSGVNEFVDFIHTISRPVEILVNNAGRFIPGEVINEEDGILEELIHTNLLSAYHLTRGLVQGMIANGRGHIFNICSVASLQAYPNGGSYSISKFAMYGFSKALREELKDKSVRVTSVMPGATYTASWEGVAVSPERMMPSEDVAALIYSAYQLSDRSVVEDLTIRPQLGDL